MCRGLNVKNTYLEACGDEGNVVVGGRKIGFIDLRWSETKLREGVGGRNASKNAVARFDLPALLIIYFCVSLFAYIGRKLWYHTNTTHTLDPKATRHKLLALRKD